MQHSFSSLRFQSICLILLFILVSWNTTTAQAPQKMSYQSVVRDAGGALVTNSPVGVKISIVRNSFNGTVVYEETHTSTTNTNGLATLEIGTGTVVTGVFDTIDWSEGPYFLKSETDPEGGTNYTVSSISQLMSVPYAMHADNAYWELNTSNIHNMNAGNVGIGTSSPQHTLEVRSSSTPDFEGIIHAEYTGNGLNPNGDIINPYGIYVKSQGNDNNGVGGRFEGGFIGVDGYVMPTGSGYVSTGVSGTVVGGNGENYGVRANASGFGTNYGIYATGSLGTTDYAGYFSGDVTITGTLTNPSDVKFKKDINIYKDALQKLNDVNVYSYKYRQIGSMNFPGKKRIGFIAQDLEKAFPGLVKEEVDAVPGKAPGNLRRVIRYKGVNYIGMIPILTQAIKEQQSEISSLKVEKKEIKDENRHLRKRLNSLEKEVAEIKVLLDNT